MRRNKEIQGIRGNETIILERIVYHVLYDIVIVLFDFVCDKRCCNRVPFRKSIIDCNNCF